VNRLYKEWLAGEGGNPNSAPSYTMSYVDFLAERIIALEDKINQVKDDKEEVDK
jgi:hypothetical protein